MILSRGMASGMVFMANMLTCKPPVPIVTNVYWTCAEFTAFMFVDFLDLSAIPAHIDLDIRHPMNQISGQTPCSGKLVKLTPIVWMDEILHHLRIPGMMIHR